MDVSRDDMLKLMTADEPERFRALFEKLLNGEGL